MHEHARKIPGGTLQMNKRLRLPMALALVLGTSNVMALGLGQIQVKSALNQPLVAEIPVLVSSPGEADALSVRLASPDAFVRVGLDRPTLQATNLMFEVRTDKSGRPVIRITTPDKVTDPFLSFLLEVDWGKGKMLREYTALLDPPSMMPLAGKAPVAATPVARPETVRTEPLLETPPPMPEPLADVEPPPPSAPAVEPVAATPASAPAPAPAPVPEPTAAAPAPAAAAQVEPSPVAGSHTVNRGDTLWQIAQNTRPDASVSMNQMMLALLRANPEAFADGNINRLRKGAVLRIPGREEAATLGAAEAAAQVREQMQSWSGTVATLSQPADASAVVPPPTPRARRTEAPASGASRNTDSRLELTPPRGTGSASASTSGAAVDGAGKELRAELARSREEVATLTQENTELKSRVGDLEQLQGENRRLIELKDSELAAAQRRLRRAEAALAKAQAEAGVATAQATPGATETTPEAAPETAPETATADPGSTTVASGTEATPSEPAPAPETVAAEPVPPPAPVAEPAQPTPTPAVAEPAAPAKPGLFGLNPWILGGGAALLIGVLALLGLARRGKKAAAPKSTPSPLPVTASQPAVAPYQPDQLEGELIEAISQHPDDLELHLDLLRHYHASNDALGFEMAAEAMHRQVRDDADPIWQEVCVLAADIAPEHPLFAGGSASVASAPAHGSEAEHEDDFIHEDEPGHAAESDDDVDWQAGDGMTRAEDDLVTSAAVDEFSTAGAELDEPFFQSLDAGHEADVAGDDEGIDADSATTKLELARAYLDMGDVEGARGMLEEVLAEGNAMQREDARKMLADNP